MDVDAVTIPAGALVFGSLPPGGRDLDLLVRPEREAEVAEALRDQGFERRGRIWVRFGHGTDAVEPIELVSAASWGLPAAEIEAIFSTATPIGSGLLEPSPPHRLLVASRRAMREGSLLAPKLAERLSAALAADPGALAAARDHAPAWGATRALDLTRDALERGSRMRWSRRGRALVEEWRARGASRSEALTRAARTLVPKRRRGILVSFSGLDGSGKTTQVEALAGNLDRLGFEVETEWVSLHPPRWLDRLARAIKRALHPKEGGRPRNPDDPVRALRSRSPLLTHAWSSVVALRLALRAGVMIRSRLWRGRSVVCDRYVLDASTYMRYEWGVVRSFRPQLAMLRALAPRPIAGFLIEVPPEVATGRRDEYEVEQNALRAGYYDDMADRLGVARLDGTRPRESLAAEIAAEVWRRLDRS